MPWVKNKFGATVWVWDEEEEEKKDPLAGAPPPPPGSKPVKKTNKYGGPVGTKKDAYGNPYSVHQGRGGQTGNVRTGSGDTVGEKALDNAVLERARRQAAAAAAAEKRRQEMLARLNKRAKKLNRRLKDDLDAIERERQQLLEQATLARQRIEGVKAGGMATAGAMYAQKDIQRINERLLKLEHKEMRVYGLKRRGEGFDELAARNAVAQATRQYSEAKLGIDPDPYRQEAPEGARAEYGYGGLVREQYEFKYRTKPGEVGHAKNIRRALTTDLALAGQHPEWFDTQEGAEAVNAGIEAHWDQLNQHAVAVTAYVNKKQARQSEIQKRFDRTKRRYRKTGSEKDYNRLMGLIDRYKQLANDPEYRKMISEFDAIFGKTALRPDFTVTKQTQLGLYWFYETGVQHVYRQVQDRQQIIMDDLGNTQRRRDLEADVAQMRQTLTEVYDELQPQRYDPLTGEVSAQDFDSWLRDVQNNGLPAEATQMQEGAWQETVDINRRAVEVEGDVVLSHFYKSLKAEGIETNEDLKYSANLAFADKAAIRAVINAEQEFEKSDEYAKERPSNSGIYDPSRYGENVIGEYYVTDAGDLIYRHTPLPVDRNGVEHPKPLWDACVQGEPDKNQTYCVYGRSFEYAAQEADRVFRDRKREEFVAAIEKETGRPLRDYLAYEAPGSELLSAPVAVGTYVMLNLRAQTGVYPGFELDRENRHLLTDQTEIDHWGVADGALAEWLKSDEYIDPGVAAGLFDLTKYKQDDDGIYFEYVDSEGGVTKVRRGETLPVAPNVLYNGGRRIEPIWFDPYEDEVVEGYMGVETKTSYGYGAGTFESPEQKWERLGNEPPSQSKLEDLQRKMTEQYHEAFRMQAFTASGGTTDLAKALELDGDWVLLYHGKKADAPGSLVAEGVKLDVISEEDWGHLATAANAVSHALSVVAGEEITIIKRRTDGVIRQESYLTLEPPGFSGRMETPFAVYHEYGQVVKDEAGEELFVINEALKEGKVDIALEAMNDVGQPFKKNFGSASEMANFLFEMTVDVTNWIPFVGVAKRGLNGIKAAVAAGKVPANSFTAKVAASVTDAARAVRMHPDAYRIGGALARDAERSLGMQSDEFTTFLKEDLWELTDDVNTPEGYAKVVDRIAGALQKKHPNLNPAQLHQWVEDNLVHMFRANGVTVHMQPDLARAEVERMKAATSRETADAVDIESTVQARAKQANDEMKATERTARELERERAARRAKDLEAQQARVKATTGGPEVSKGVEAPKRKPAKPVEEPAAGGKPRLLADTVEGKVKAPAPDAAAAREAGRYRNRGPSLPPKRYRPRAQTQRLRDQLFDEWSKLVNRDTGLSRVEQETADALEQQYRTLDKHLAAGHGAPIGPAELRASINGALAKIAEAERKLRGQPARATMDALEKELVEWRSLKGKLQAEYDNLLDVEKAVESARGEARAAIKGVWEPVVNDEGVEVLKMVKAPLDDFKDMDLDELTDLFIEDVLRATGNWGGSLKEYEAYRKWVREAWNEVNGEVAKIEDTLSGGKLHPSTDVEKNLEIIRTQEALIAQELEYARLRMRIGQPEDLFGRYVPGTVDQVDAIYRAEGLADTLEQTALIRRVRMTEARKQALEAHDFTRHPYKLERKNAQKYRPREASGSVDPERAKVEAEHVQRFREEYGVATYDRTRSAWRTGEKVAFPPLQPPPGSLIAETDHVRMLDGAINGGDHQAAAFAWHEKALIYEQEWNRYRALTNGTDYPNGYQSFLSGAYREPENFSRLQEQNRAFRDVYTKARMDRPVDRHYMLLEQQGDEVYLGHRRDVTVENDPRGRTAKELQGEDHWFYADGGRGPLRKSTAPERVVETPHSYDRVGGTRADLGPISEVPGLGVVRLGDDIQLAKASRKSHTWYQPWDQFGKIEGDDVLAGPVGGAWRSLAESGRNVAFVREMEQSDLMGWLQALHAERVKLGWTADGAFDFRRGTQPLFDMFHLLHEAAIAGDNQAFLALERFHDVFHDVLFRGIGTKELDDFASLWLFMEARMGMPHALPMDFAEWNFKRMAKSKGMMPERAAAMVQHKYRKPTRVGQFSDLNPSVHPLFEGGAGPRTKTGRVKDAEGMNASWDADPPEPWVMTGKGSRRVGGHTYKTDWPDMYHYALAQDLTFDEMVRTTFALLRTNSIRTGQWGLSGAPLRAAVMERAVHDFVVTRIVMRGGKARFRSAWDRAAAANLYWNDLLVRGKVPPGAIDFEPQTLQFVLDDHTGRLLGKPTATLDELVGLLPDDMVDAMSFDEWAGALARHAEAHAKKGSYVIPEKVGRNPFGASKLRGSTFSGVTGAKGNAQPLREAIERGANGVQGYKRVPASSPMEAVMQFMADRAYWTDATHRSQGTARAAWFLDQLDEFHAAGRMTDADMEMAHALVRDLLGPEFRAVQHQAGAAAAAGGKQAYIVKNILADDDTMQLMERVGYSDRVKVADKAVADAKARAARQVSDGDKVTSDTARAKEDELRALWAADRRARGLPIWDEADNGWLDLGTEGGLMGRVDELQGRWDDLFKGETGAVGTPDEVFTEHMRAWDEAHPAPPTPEPRVRRKVETEKVTTPQALKEAQPGDVLTHKTLGDVEVVEFKGDMVTVRLESGRVTDVITGGPYWQRRFKTAKYEDVKGTPEVEAVRERVVKARERYEASRAAEEAKAKALAAGAGQSAEADSLVREVVDLLLTPGHGGDGQLRLARIAADMARDPRLAEGLRESIIDTFRTIPPIYDGGTAVWRDAGNAMLPKRLRERRQTIAGDTPDEALPKAPKQPKTAEELAAADNSNRTMEDFRAEADAEALKYEEAKAKHQAETNRIMGERVGRVDSDVDAAMAKAGVKKSERPFKRNGATIRYHSDWAQGAALRRPKTGVAADVPDDDWWAVVQEVMDDAEFMGPLQAEVREVRRGTRTVLDRTEGGTFKKSGLEHGADSVNAEVVRRIEARRAGGVDETVPFTDEDALRYADAGDPDVRIEVDPRDAAMDVHQGAKMAWEVLGMSEERYYQRLIRANREEMVRKGTSNARYEELSKHNENLVLALRAVRRQKKKGTYVKTTDRMQQAFEGATKVRDEVEGIIPDQKMGYLGETEEAIELEHARALRVRMEKVKRAGLVQGRGLPPKVLRRFDVKHWRGLTEEVAEAVRGVQPQRSASLNLGRRTDPNDVVDDVLRTNRDRDPVVREAVKRAIREYCERNNIPQWNVELYWRVRTLVRGSEGKMRRGIGMLETAGPDMDALLNLRRAAADREAFEHVKWWLYNNPHATPEEAAEYFRLTAGSSGVISDVQEVLTEADIYILGEFVKHFTGVDDLDDVVKMRDALGKHGKPPLDNRYDMRAHQERVGRWSPRTTDEVITKGAWNIDDEAEYWALNYEDVPAWIDDQRIRRGTAFHDHDVYQAVMKETGGFNDGARLERAKTGEVNVDFDDYSYGKKDADGNWLIKPKKDWEVQRKYAIERYGERVAKDGRFHAMPWLMTPDELIEYVSKHGEVKGIISNPAEIRTVMTAIQEVNEKYVGLWMKAHAGDATNMVLSSGDIHRMTFDLVQRLSVTTPWVKVLSKAGGRKMTRNALDVWGSFWTGLILMNPAFTVSNAIDVPTKGLLFGLSEKFAKKGRVSARAKAAVPNAHAVGHGSRSQFFYSGGARDAGTRVLGGLTRRVDEKGLPVMGYGLADRAAGVWDAVTGGIASHVLEPVEDITKTKLAQQLFDGLWDEYADVYLKGTKHKFLNPQGVKLTEEQVTLMLKLRIRDRLKTLFPSLSDAGIGERMLNRLLPFISYNVKNRMLWTSWVLDHPWSIRLLQEGQAQLKAHNEREWRERHGDLPMPENLSHQIRIGNTEFYLDIGMFTDAARGAEWVTGGLSFDGIFTTDDLEDMVRLFIRPLPTQEAFVRQFLYDLTDATTGRGWGGRYVWRRVIDPETGFWDRTGGPDGNGWVQDYVPPGTAWGDRKFDYLNDMMPFEGLRKTLGDALRNGSFRDDDAVRIIGNLMDFQEFGHVSETYGLYMQYKQLLGPDEENPNYEAAQDWFLNTRDGQRLAELWAQGYWDPDAPGEPYGYEMHLNQYQSLFYDADGNFKVPEAKEMRRRFLEMQPPEMAALIREANQQFYALRDGWDQMMDSVDPLDDEMRQHLWAMRRASEGALSHQYPEVYAYWAFGMPPDEAEQYRLDSVVDLQRARYYAAFDWDDAPERGTPEFADWEKRREAYLRANPQFAATLADEYSEWQASLNRTQRTRDLAISNMEGAERIRTWANSTDRRALAEAASTLMEYNARAFNMESAGYDHNGEWKFRHDSGWRKYLRGDDPRKVWYADVMRSVGKKAVDEDGNFDVNKWWRIIDRNPELRAEYLEREGMSREEWGKKGALYQFHSQWARALDKQNWDKAWRLYENLPKSVMDYWEEQNPKGFRERMRSYEYSTAMGRWVAYFERGDSAGAMRFFNSLPKWMRDRYYENNPGKQLSKGQHSAYIQTLDSVFNYIDAGDWDSAEAVWNAAPSWVRSQYYANNPGSTLFRGGERGGGGISDAKFRQYTSAMKKWVDLLKDDRDEAAQRYFDGLPQWMKDFYFQNNPDKKWQMQNDRMFALAAEYFVADRAAQKAMLERNPGLRRWLNENDTKAARADAIRAGYYELPDDPWLRRVYKEKYPEVFGREQKGKRDIESVMDIISQHGPLADEWLRQYRGIVKSMQEALKYMHPRPRQLEQDYSKMREPSRGLSAADLSRQPEAWLGRVPVKRLREPRIS